MTCKDGDVDPAGYQRGICNQNCSDLFLDCDVALPGGSGRHEICFNSRHARRLTRDLHRRLARLRSRRNNAHERHDSPAAVDVDPARATYRRGYKRGLDLRFGLVSVAWVNTERGSVATS